MATSKYEQNRKSRLLDNPALAAMRASQQAKASAKWRKKNKKPETKLRQAASPGSKEQNRKRKLLDNPILAAKRASQLAKASAKSNKKPETKLRKAAWRKKIQVQPKSKILRKSLSNLPGNFFSLAVRIGQSVEL
jgi:hypothetical protein